MCGNRTRIDDLLDNVFSRLSCELRKIYCISVIFKMASRRNYLVLGLNSVSPFASLYPNLWAFLLPSFGTCIFIDMYEYLLKIPMLYIDHQ